MSYASVAAHNAPPLSQQPHPDPGLYDTDKPTASGIADDMAKVTVVSSEYKENPRTVTSETEILTERDDYGLGGDKSNAKKKTKDLKVKAKRDFDKAEAEGEHLWDITKEQLLRPGVAGGLLGIVNVGLLGTASYYLYTKPHLRSDTRFLSTLAISSLSVLGLEGFVAERYAKTPRGQEEAQRAKAEGAAIYRHTKEVIIRPGVLGGIVGFLNVGILGTVGWFAYSNWDAPRWDRRIVSAVSVGLICLWGGEGVLAEKYHEES